MFLLAILPLFWFVFKVFTFLFLYVWVRGTLPRFRYDQLMNYGWRFLFPLAILNIVGTSLWLAYRCSSANATDIRMPTPERYSVSSTRRSRVEHASFTIGEDFPKELISPLLDRQEVPCS